MDVQTNDAPQGGEPLPVVITTPGEGALSITEAGRALARARHDKPKEQAQPAGAEKAAEVEQPQSAPQGDDAAAVETQPPGETESQVEPEATLPLIEPPRSWTKAEQEEFATYPREAQEKIARREQERDAATRRSQNEAAEKLKGLTAKEQAVEQARTQYESALPILLSNLQSGMAAEFSDIKTMADVQRLARDDFPRYAQWDAAQKQVAAVQQEALAAQQRQHTEKISRFSEFAKEQDGLLVEKVPEMADAKKSAEMQSSALATLKAVGYAEEELGSAWRGDKELSLRDHRMQLLILDASRWRDAQAKAKTVTAKPVPPVQRPGVSQPKGAAQTATIEALTKKLDTSSGVNALRTASALLRAKRAAR